MKVSYQVVVFRSSTVMWSSWEVGNYLTQIVGQDNNGTRCCNKARRAVL